MDKDLDDMTDEEFISYLMDRFGFGHVRGRDD